ncbi:hypothetical protein F5884DRAFT_329671 [Xylogone sp. PMI_703]|nr:hypothetical protein F5884DRAFT_329671 [Xylogone sp. PMI_703]
MYLYRPRRLHFDGGALSFQQFGSCLVKDRRGTTSCIAPPYIYLWTFVAEGASTCVAGPACTYTRAPSEQQTFLLSRRRNLLGRQRCMEVVTVPGCRTGCCAASEALGRLTAFRDVRMGIRTGTNFPSQPMAGPAPTVILTVLRGTSFSTARKARVVQGDTRRTGATSRTTMYQKARPNSGSGEASPRTGPRQREIYNMYRIYVLVCFIESGKADAARARVPGDSWYLGRCGQLVVICNPPPSRASMGIDIVVTVTVTSTSTSTNTSTQHIPYADGRVYSSN